MDGELVTVDTVLGLGRRGAAIFAACCAERLRTLLRFVPSGAPPLVAGVGLTALWRVFEGLDKPDPRYLAELATACWTLVEIEPVPKVKTEHLEALVSATHGALEAYLSGNPEHALKAAQASHSVAGEGERGRQRRDAAEIDAARDPLPGLVTALRKRSESEGERIVRTLV
jgi:hypothetical protein